VWTTLADALLAWSRETFYNITRKASSLARQYKFPLIPSTALPPSQWSYVPKLNVSSLWIFANATVSIINNDTPVTFGGHTSEHMPFFSSNNFNFQYILFSQTIDKSGIWGTVHVINIINNIVKGASIYIMFAIVYTIMEKQENKYYIICNTL
jgi:hypothetical protein